MYHVLVSDKLSDEGIELLEKEKNITVTVNTGLSPEELKSCIANYDAIIIRSKTTLTPEILAAAENLRVIARAGVGVDNIDIDAATRQGIIVMNTPGGNSISTAELAVAHIMSMTRNIPQAYASLKAGKWDKKKFTGYQLTGKKVAVIGLGRIGQEVVKRLKGLKMSVIAYDPYTSDKRAKELGIDLAASVMEAAAKADYLTVHTPLTDETRGIIGKDVMDAMSDGARIINCARGGIVDEEALLDALTSGKIAGAAFDVYTQEPPEDRRLLECDTFIGTPHLGASTHEAQENVARDAASQVIDVLLHNNVRFAVNYPELSASDLEELKPYITLSEKIGSIQCQILKGQPKSLNISYRGKIAEKSIAPLTSAVTFGFLKNYSHGRINYINAKYLAEEHGIRIIESRDHSYGSFSNLISVTVETESEIITVDGTVFGGDKYRIVNIGDFPVEAIPEGIILLTRHEDKPGFIGLLGTELGRLGVNIANMALARHELGGTAMAVVNIDGCLPEGFAERFSRMEGLIESTVLNL